MLPRNRTNRMGGWMDGSIDRLNYKELPHTIMNARSTPSCSWQARDTEEPMCNSSLHPKAREHQWCKFQFKCWQTLRPQKS